MDGRAPAWKKTAALKEIIEKDGLEEIFSPKELMEEICCNPQD